MRFSATEAITQVLPRQLLTWVAAALPANIPVNTLTLVKIGK